MFRTMLSPADRRKLAEEYVAQRALLKSRFLTERLEKQDATAAYKKGIAPPARANYYNHRADSKTCRHDD